MVSVWAVDAVAFAAALARVDPTWGTRWFELAGGYVVLSGPGMYVNRAMAVGRSAPLTDDDWEQLESAAAEAGVPPAIEITSTTHPDVRHTAARRGYTIDDRDTAFARRLDHADVPEPDPAFEVVPASRGLLPVWQETSALGWGHTAPSARRASDAFARAAAIVDGDRLSLVRDRESGRPVGCASMTIRDGLATLGGMSTVPGARGRGVQTALIRHRIREAAAAGCDVATSMAVPGGGSERNLLRHGFDPIFTVETWMRRDDEPGAFRCSS